jgi:hypothetical protein
MSRLSLATVFGTFILLATILPALGADEKPVAEVRYYLGESRMMTPDGKLLRTSLSLVKRVLSQADSRIEEHVLSVGDKDAKAFVVVMAVKGKKFTVTERSKTFTGAGELQGEAWKWKGWKSVTKLAGGAGMVTSEDKLTDQGCRRRSATPDPTGRSVCCSRSRSS